MEFQKKINRDFEFYSIFTQSLRNFPNKKDDYLCEAWTRKLLNEQYIGIGNQCNRNIFLANLVLCIQRGKLGGPFIEYPPDFGLPNAVDVFGKVSPQLKIPTWLNSVVDNDLCCNVRAKDKRTYLATKTMPDGKGALGYIAVSLAEGEPQWIQKDGGFFENRDYKKTKDGGNDYKYKKDESHDKPLKYYQHILNEIKKELSTKLTNEHNEDVDRLLKLQVDHLRKRGILHQYEHLSPEIKRRTFLLLLQDKISKRISKLAKINKDYFDNKKNRNETGDANDVDFNIEDPVKNVQILDGKMSINQLHNKLTQMYPAGIVRNFLHFLSFDKKKLTKEIKNKNNKIVRQLKKDFCEEYLRNKKKCEDAQYALNEIEGIFMKFKRSAEQAEEKKIQVEEINYKKFNDQDSNRIRLEKSLSQAEKLIEEEQKRGQWLQEAIINMQLQTKRYKKFNERNLKNIENANVILINDIKKLSKAITMYEN